MSLRSLFGFAFPDQAELVKKEKEVKSSGEMQLTALVSDPAFPPSDGPSLSTLVPQPGSPDASDAGDLSSKEDNEFSTSRYVDLALSQLEEESAEEQRICDAVIAHQASHLAAAAVVSAPEEKTDMARVAEDAKSFEDNAKQLVDILKQETFNKTNELNDARNHIEKKENEIEELKTALIEARSELQIKTSLEQNHHKKFDIGPARATSTI